MAIIIKVTTSASAGSHDCVTTPAIPQLVNSLLAGWDIHTETNETIVAQEGIGSNKHGSELSMIKVKLLGAHGNFRGAKTPNHGIYCNGKPMN